jgi:predicted CoA-substrate-specific enzyme activase
MSEKPILKAQSANKAASAIEEQTSKSSLLYSASTLFYDGHTEAMPSQSQDYSGGASEITGTMWVGIDVGSTTAKIAVLEPLQKKLLFWKYRRHFSRQAETVAALLSEVHEAFPRAIIKTSICGSGAEPLAAIIGGCFIQEVIANSIAVSEIFPFARTSVELGGQDAKILFFREDEITRKPKLSDMRMNGCCAGGTGAFIDQIARLLDLPIERFDEAARKGKTVFDISGRCGVFAKTDLQPLLNMGVSKEDLALSVFHAVSKQTITGLGHGMQLSAPVVFLGGPFTFNRELVKVFAGHLNLSAYEILIPPLPQVAVAIGAAFAVGVVPEESQKPYLGRKAIARLTDSSRSIVADTMPAPPFFKTQEELTAFRTRHAAPPFVPKSIPAGTSQDVYVGIDAGSTTIKFVLMDDAGSIINKFYASNSGNPIGVVKKALIDIYDSYRSSGVRLNVRGLGTTGYGEALVAKAFGADFHTVETIAHAHAALHFVPNATFVLDLGGQDMKAMRISNGVICDLYLNEACSAGCGSFIETLSSSLNIPIENVAELAFQANSPSNLGSRCTVFMNSSITTEQKNGKSIEDIIAGLCRSVVDNLFMKVIRDRNVSYLGNTIVVQGGTFKNDAVLRAFEQHTSAEVIRPQHVGEMGALGIALLTKDAVLLGAKGNGGCTSFIGFEALRTFECSGVTNDKCGGCSNSCKRTIVRFNNGSVYCAGNRCEKGSADFEPGASSGAKPAAKQAPSMVRFRESAMLRDYTSGPRPASRGQTIGIPRVLEFYNSLPFWKTLFSALGYTVVLSPRSNQSLHEKGMRFVASDNICFPAKLSHGHMEYLVEKNVDRIFMPLMVTVPSTLEDKNTVHVCPVVQGYPMVLREMNKPHLRKPLSVDSPAFVWSDERMRRRQVGDFLRSVYGIPKKEAGTAIDMAEKALAQFRASMAEEGGRVLSSIEAENGMGVILAGRPYHYDPFINHGVPEVFSALNIPLLTMDSIPGRERFDLSRTRPELYNPFHSEIYCAGLFAAEHPCLEVVQLVSFGCGHDAIISDELARIMQTTSGKQPLVLKIDEGEALGALGIRIRSFVETVRRRRS